MGTRAHVSVTILLTSTLASGCIFGGGNKKPAAKAAHATAAATPDPSTLASATAKSRQGKQTRAGASAGTPDADALLERALQPKEPAIKWLNPDALSLGAEEPVRRPQPVPQPGAAAAPRTAVVAPETPAAPVEPQPAPVHAVPQQWAATVQPGGTRAAVEAYTGEAPVATPSSAVANKGMNLADETAVPAASSAWSAAETPPTAVVGSEPVGAVAGAQADLVRRTSQRLRENPGDLAAHLDHQLTRFLGDAQVPDLNALSTLPAEDRELLVALVDGLSNFRSNLRDDQNQLLSRKVRPLLEMADRVRNQAELSIPTIALCKRVDGFGLYEPMDGRFVARAWNEMLVYCEVANVSSQQDPQGWWESKLSQEAVLYKENGQRVWSNERVATPDRARNRRNDFFVAQRVLLPPNLSIDRYILKVTVLDEQVKRVAEATVPIQIVASLGPQPFVPLTTPAAPAPPAPPAEDRAAPDARTAGARQPAPAPTRRITPPPPAGRTQTANGQ